MATGTGIDPKVDYAFKRIWDDEDNALVLVDVLMAYQKGKIIGRIQLLQQLLKQPETTNEELRFAHYHRAKRIRL